MSRTERSRRTRGGQAMAAVALSREGEAGRSGSRSR